MATQLDYPIPQRPSTTQLLTAFNSASVRWPGALRAGLAILLPGAIALLTGHDYAILLISTGAFTVIFGEGHPYRTRPRVMLTAGTALITVAAVGVLVGHLIFAPGHGHWWLLLAGLYTTALAAVCGFAQNALRLPPPGTFFLVMVGGGSVMLARTDVTVGQLLFWALTGMVASLVLGMAPALIDAHGPERRAVAALEKAAAAFKDDRDDSLARHHQAQTALFAAWQALSDARIIRGGRIIDSQGAHLVERALAAQHTIVAHNRALDLGSDSDQLTDNVTDVDPDRTAIPHTRPTGRYRLYRAAVRDSHAMVTTQKVVLSAAIIVLVGLTLGFDRPDWGVVSAFLMLQWGPDHVPGTVRGIHRMLGSVVGVLLFSILHYFGISGWTLLLALTACQFCAEIFVAKTTPSALSSPPHLPSSWATPPPGPCGPPSRLAAARSSYPSSSPPRCCGYGSAAPPCAIRPACRSARWSPWPPCSACSLLIPQMPYCPRAATCNTSCSRSAAPSSPSPWITPMLCADSGHGTLPYNTPVTSC